MRRDRGETAAADERHAAPLRLDAASRLHVVDIRDEVCLTRSHLQGERTLPRLGQHHGRVEAQPDLAAEPEPVEPAGGEHDRVETALAALPQACFDIAAQGLDRQRRLEREQLGTPARGGRADAHPGPDLRATAERVAWILALGVGADDEPFGVGGGHVLGGVHGHVDAVLEQGFLELLDEDAARADLAERTRAVMITGSGDGHKSDLDPGPAKSLGGPPSLGESEPTAAGTDAQQHGSGDGWLCGSRRTRAARVGGCGRTRSVPEAAAADRSTTAAS